jgi:hypothetical protein
MSAAFLLFLYLPHHLSVSATIFLQRFAVGPVLFFPQRRHGAEARTTSIAWPVCRGTWFDAW